MGELLRPYEFEFFRNGLIVATFAGALGAPGPFNVRCRPTRAPSPARRARAITGTNPAQATRLSSSNTATRARPAR